METQNLPCKIAVNYTVIGRNLKSARVSKSLRQEDVADYLGISITHYSNCERGTRRIALDLIANACYYLHVPLFMVLLDSIDGIQLLPESSPENVEHGDIPSNEWIREFSRIQYGCSDVARKYMIEACRNIAALDKS